MRYWTVGSIGAALIAAIAAAWGCGSGGGGSGGAATGGTGAATGGTGAGGEGSASHGAACTVEARGLEVSRGGGTTPAITWTGAGFAVAWQERGADGGDIHLAALDADGNRVREEVIDGGPNVSSHPSVHRDGEGLLVLWQDRDGAGSLVRGRRATLAGVPEGSAFDVGQSSAAEAWPLGAATQDGVVVAWMDTRGSQLKLLGIGALSSAMPVDQARFPAVAAGGARTALAWAQGDAIGFARLDPESPAIDPVLYQGVAAQLTRVALGGDDAFVVWEDTRTGTEQIRAIRVSAQGEMSREALVSDGGGSANWPAPAWTGSGLAVAYYQFRERYPSVIVTILSPDLTPTGVDLVVSEEAHARFPAMAWTGRELGVAYAEKDQGVRLSRVSCR
ncbi:hypothetical protein [Sorangium sp. So ce131]|uniref:hypothetical protein n=1 Tax=Sorangium sp. So ce131 TaxID=3133282 RepID=UPI003F646405